MLLSEEDFLRTYADPMRDVTADGDAKVDIWPYVEAIPRSQLGPFRFEDGVVGYVWRSGDERYDHVLLPSSIANVYLVVVVDLRESAIYGHHILDLNQKYGRPVPPLLAAWTEAQAICASHGVEPLAPSGRVGVALSTLGQDPLNGLRVKAAEGECDWYIWGGGEMSRDPDFFEPMHTSHLAEHCPAVLRYLALPPGWRFLLGKNDYVDVWFDATTLE